MHTMMMNNLPDMFIDKLLDYLINNIIMFNCHPCADIINQAVEDEYKDEHRECAIIGRRVVFTYSARNVRKQGYTYNEKVISY